MIFLPLAVVNKLVDIKQHIHIELQKELGVYELLSSFKYLKNTV